MHLAQRYDFQESFTRIFADNVYHFLIYVNFIRNSDHQLKQKKPFK